MRTSGKTLSLTIAIAQASLWLSLGPDSGGVVPENVIRAEADVPREVLAMGRGSNDPPAERVALGSPPEGGVQVGKAPSGPQS